MSSRRIAVCLEVAPKSSFASALDWPGWCRAGRDEGAALEALASYAGRYAPVAEQAGGRLPGHGRVPCRRVGARRARDAFAAPECRRPFAQVTAGAERATVTPAAARRLAGLVTAAWATFGEVAAASPAELRKGPRGGGRDRDQLIGRVIGAETAYARKLGVKLRQPAIGDIVAIEKLREAIAAVVGAPFGRLTRGAGAAGPRATRPAGSPGTSSSTPGRCRTGRRASPENSRRTGWLKGLRVTADGTGIVSHAGVALIRALSDNIGLTGGLSRALASDRLLFHDRGRVLADLACAIADGGEAISDFRVIGDQAGLFGPVASVPTAWRALSEIAASGEAGLGGVTTAVNFARRAAWAQTLNRHGALPGVRVADKVLDGVACIRLDASVVPCHSDKQGAEPNFQGFGYHPLLAYCDNTGEPLAGMLRPGSAGSNTAGDHLKVLDAAIVALPPGFRRRLMVTVDGAGASHELITHLDKLASRPGHQVIYSVGWELGKRVACLGIRFCVGCALDHPDDHPDDHSVSVWSRLDRRGIQPEQARSFSSHPDRRRTSDS
jgi:Transposase DDE domain group 1